MSPRVSEELALDLALEGRIAAASPEVERLMALAARLAELPDPEIDPRFAARLEARLLAETDQVAPAERPLKVVRPEPNKPATPVKVAPAKPVKPASVIPLPRRRVVLRKAMVAAIAAALALALPMTMVPTALPGSPLYGAKQWTEALRCAVKSGASQAVCNLRRVQSLFSDLEESLAVGNERGATEAISLMSKLEGSAIDKAIRSGDRGAMTEVQSMLADLNGRIEALVETAPAGVRPALQQAVADGHRLSGRVAAALGGTDPSTSGTASQAGGTAAKPAEVNSSVSGSFGSNSGSTVGGMDDPTRGTPSTAPGKGDVSGSRDGSTNDEKAPCALKFAAVVDTDGACEAGQRT